MKIKPVFQFLYALLIIILLSSCGLRKNIVYFQTDELDTSSYAISDFSIKLQVDDIVTVMVSSDDIESAKPFNFPVREIGIQPMMNGYLDGMTMLMGYLIDENGNINLPGLGEVHVLGLTRVELSRKLKSLYEEYLRNPVVNVSIVNFRVSILGDVKKPGTFNIPNEKFTILQAIALAGDLMITAKRKNIVVLRQENGKTKEYRVDLTRKDIINSPVFYLKQNDVIYVEPNITARTQAALWRTTGGLVLSVASFAITTFLLISNSN